MLASFLIDWVKVNYKRQDGQAMAEYGIILALIAAICIGLIALLGKDILAALGSVTNAL